MGTETESATQRLSHALQATLDSMSHDLNRVELLTAALTGFSRPVPDYEPTFLHLHNATLRKYELGDEALEPWDSYDGQPHNSPSSSRRWRSEASE